MKVYGLPISARSTAACVVLDACGLEYETEWLSLEESKSERILKLNPQGKLPILETPQGPVYETAAIIRHAARLSKTLGGQSDHEHALVDQWISWVNSEVASTLGHFAYQTLGFDFPTLSYKHDDVTKGKEAFLRQMEFLNKHLQGRTSVVGSGLTIADYFIAVLAYHPLAFCFGAAERATVPNVIALLEAVGQTPAFARWFGRLRWSEHALAVPHPAKKDKPAAPKKEQAPAKPKEEKPKKAPKEEEEDLEKPVKKEEPKFPDTQLNLMTFKTFFINEPNLETALEGFWSQFKEGEWSLWHLTYLKYPGECEVVYRTNNLLRTFLSRLEEIRKYIFGTHVIIGDEPSLEIEGVWLIRGDRLFEGITEIDVYDTYKWDKLDSTNPEHRALVKDFWTHRKEEEEQVQGKTIRTFKWIK